MRRLYGSGPTQLAALRSLVDAVLAQDRDVDVSTLAADCTLNAAGQVLGWHLTVDTHPLEEPPS